jgi:hypothetical protein
MLTYYLKEPGTQRQYRCGPVGPYLDEFTRWLEQRGYRCCCLTLPVLNFSEHSWTVPADTL